MKYDLCVQVLFFDVAFDGLQMGKKYTVNMYILRCRDTPPDLAVNTSNIHLLMLIPGPKDPPQGFAAHTNLMLHLFHAYGPKSGANRLLMIASHSVRHGWMSKDVGSCRGLRASQKDLGA